jgi:predicted ATP-grasp superfamily ATP-dependent carboligase
MMLQEYIPGPPTNHYFVDGFVDGAGVVRARFVRQRLRMYPPDFGNSTLMVSVPPEQAADALRTLDTLLADLQYRGIFSAEFKRDARDGRFNLIEVNARPWWYVEYAARCGVDVCAMAVQDALGRPVTSIERYTLGRRCAYPSYDWSAVRAEHLGISTAMRDWIGAVQPVFKWSDPRPSLHEALGTLRRRLA